MWSYYEEELKNEGTSFFRNSYSEGSMVRSRINFGGTYPPFDSSVLVGLGSMASSEEVKNAIFSMGALKGPGPDGLNPLFYQNQWEVVGKYVVEMVRNFFSNPSDVKRVNGTLISLIPKVELP